MDIKTCKRCKKDFTNCKNFVHCIDCRSYKQKHTKSYIDRLKTFSNNRQCEDCIIFYEPNWICIHSKKRLRTLKELGIDYIRNGNNQFTYKKFERISKNKQPIPSEKFKIEIIYI